MSGFLLNPYVHSSVSPTYGKAYFDGVGDYLKVGDVTTFNSLHQVGTTGKWTIEFKYQTTSLSAINGMFDTCATLTANRGISIFLRTTGVMTVQISAGGANVIDFNTGSNFITADGSSHDIEISYDQSLSSNNLKIFKDGTLVSQGTKTSTTPSTADATYIATIGSCQTTYYTTGYLRGLRITKNIVRHTSAYTPPSSFSVDDETNVLLCMNFQESVGSTTFIDDTGKTVTTFGNVVIVA